jgi:plasmid stabilization system protein ParE
MGHHLSTRAKSDLDDIWEYLYQQSGSVDIADQQIDEITKRFCLLSRRPRIGRPRDDDLGPGTRSFPSGGI